jgi:hypothetical protein
MTPITTFLDYPPKRGLLWLGLSETGRFLTRGTVSDGGGGVTETYTPAGTADWASTTNVECRIDVIGGVEGQIANRISDRSTHIVTMAAGTAVFSINNDFQIQGRGRYEITAIREHTGQMAAQIEVTDRTT